MLKRVFIVFMVVFMFAMPIVVSADVVLSNDFLGKNYDKTQKLDRASFCVNGPDGYVTPKEQPGSKKSVENFKFKNGDTVYMDRVYLYKGQYWGALQEGHSTLHGWIPMDYLLVMYVQEDFNEEHKSDFYPDSGNYDVEGLKSKNLVIWSWPGSDGGKWMLSNNENGYIIEEIIINQVYKDNESREWGYVNIKYEYLYGHGWLSSMDVWICLSEPENNYIPAFNPAPESVKWSPPENFENMFNINILLLITISIIVLIISTAVLIKIFWKPNKMK